MLQPVHVLKADILQENHGYISVTGDTSIQVHITAERCILGTTNNAISILVGFNYLDIVYPKAIYSVFICMQHFTL